jgi:hypothetical protein
LYHYDPIPQKALLSSKDKKIVNVNSANDCATYCDNELNIHCKSFNYCPDSNLCYLSETHLVNCNELSSSIFCDHYSSNKMSILNLTFSKVL